MPLVSLCSCQVMQNTHLDHGVLVRECEAVQNDQCSEFMFLFSTLRAHMHSFCQKKSDNRTVWLVCRL